MEGGMTRNIQIKRGFLFSTLYYIILNSEDLLKLDALPILSYEFIYLYFLCGNLKCTSKILLQI